MKGRTGLSEDNPPATGGREEAVVPDYRTPPDITFDRPRPVSPTAGEQIIDDTLDVCQGLFPTGGAFGVIGASCRLFGDIARLIFRRKKGSDPTGGL